ncbi:MAG: hypothetical protein HYU52_10110 [Acidobacteria bacterium]|nr:hypothetical protein [Acidobacteriota bacterium]
MEQTRCQFRASIGLFVATSLGVAAVVLFAWWNIVAIVPGITVAFALLYGSLLLVREARLAIVSTFEEMEYARENVKATRPGDAQR